MKQKAVRQSLPSTYGRKKGRYKTQHIVSLHLERHVMHGKMFLAEYSERVAVIAVGERNRLTNGLEWKGVME